MDPSLKVIEYIRNTAEYVRTEDGLVSASAMLERFLFPPEEQYGVIGKLSGGEKRRLNLLRVLMEAPNVLILDEPTNDLDITTLAILEDYLDNYDGIVITVSHDRYFLDRVVKRLFVYDGYGQIRQFEGSYTDYYLEYGTFANSVKSGSGSAKPAPASKGKPAADSSKSGVAEKDTAPKRAKNKFTFNEQREYDTIEDDIAACEETIDGLDREIAASTTDFTKLNHLMAEKENAELKLEHLMERYVYLTDLLESFKK